MPVTGAFLAYTPQSWMLPLLSFVKSVLYWTDLTSRFTCKLFQAASTAFYPETFVMFGDSPTVYNPSKLSIGASGSPPISWGYTLDTFTFSEWCGSYYNTFVGPIAHSHPLPALSIEIVENDRVIYDLTDWAEKVRVLTESEGRRTPSVAQILAAWTLSSGIVLDAPRFTVRLMNEQADTVETSCTDTRPISFINDPPPTEDSDSSANETVANLDLEAVD
jgi:hypothetical protein